MDIEISEGYQRIPKVDSEGNQLYILPIEPIEVPYTVPRTFKSTDESDNPCMVNKQIPLLDGNNQQKEYELTQAVEQEDGSIFHVGTGQVIKLFTTIEVQEKDFEGNLLYWNTVEDSHTRLETQSDEYIISDDERWTEELELLYQLVKIPPTPLTPEQFAKLKQDKIDTFWDICTKEIESGFYSSATGTEYLYGFDAQDRENLAGTLTLMNSLPSLVGVEWKPKGVMPYFHNRNQFLQICLDGFGHKQSKINKYWVKRSAIESALTVEELNSVSW